MNKKISISGKGGCGKSVIVALISKMLTKKKNKVLVIDCDESNMTLHRMLGLEYIGRPMVEYESSGIRVMREFENAEIYLETIPKVSAVGLKPAKGGRIKTSQF